MKKYIAGFAVLALCVVPSAIQAGPPGFYSGGTYVQPFNPPALVPTPFGYAPVQVGPTTSGYNSFTSPYGYQTYNSYSYTPTPWGWSGYNYSNTYVQPYSVGPTHSVYWDPFNNTYQYSYGTGSGFNYGSTPAYSRGYVAPVRRR